MSDQSFDTQIDTFNFKEFIQNILSKISNLNTRVFNLETADQGSGGTGMASFVVAGDSGPSQTITDGNTLTVAGGTGIDSVASATDTVTLNIGTHTHLSAAQGGTLSLPASTITSGQLAVNYGGTGADLSAASVGHVVFNGVFGTLAYNLSASAAPTVNDDSGDGYGVGSLWIDTTNDKSYYCVDATVGAAVWNDLSTGGGMTSFTAAGDAGTPQTITNGDTLTIAGGVGLTTTASATDTVTIDIDTVPLANGGTNADLSAVGPGYLTQATLGSNVSTIKNNWTTTVAPTANEDSGDGYSVGSYWYDTTADKVYVCIDNTLGAAVWKDITSSGTFSSFSLAGTSGTPQSITDGNTATIAAGTGITTTAGATDTVTVAVSTIPLANGGTNTDLSATGPGYLVQTTTGANVSLKLNNWSAAVAPTVNEDSGDGYSVGSYWYDTTNDAVYVCIDATLGAAVWKAITGSLTVRDGDSSPSVSNVTTIVVTDGTLTDDGGGQVTILTGSGGGSSSANTNDTLIWLGW